MTPQELAKAAVEAYVREKRIIDPPDELEPPLDEKAGAFVCLKIDGNLRGCIGTVLPTTENVATEIVHNAVQSAVADPRFLSVTPDELAGIEYSVDVLSQPEPVSGPEELDPKRYGCIARAADGVRQGLLLPDLEGVDTVAQQVAICRQKGGIRPDEPVSLFRFTVTRYGG